MNAGDKQLPVVDDETKMNYYYFMVLNNYLKYQFPRKLDSSDQMEQYITPGKGFLKVRTDSFSLEELKESGLLQYGDLLQYVNDSSPDPYEHSAIYIGEINGKPLIYQQRGTGGPYEIIYLENMTSYNRSAIDVYRYYLSVTPAIF